MKSDLIILNTNNYQHYRIAQNQLLEGFEHFLQPRLYPQQSLSLCCDYFNKIKGDIIVECGTGLQGELSGNSMLYWFHQTAATKILCIDLELKWIESVKNALGESEKVEYYVSDCFEIVGSLQQTIDLLYIDFWIGNGQDRAEAYLELYKISNYPKLILIDDTDHTDPWKQTLIVPKALEDSYYVGWIGRQTLLVRNDIYEKL